MTSTRGSAVTPSRENSESAVWRPMGPGGTGGRLRHAVADLQQDLQVLHGAGQIPIGLHLVGRLMVVVADVLLPFAVAIFCGSVDEVDARAGRE